MTDFIVSNSKNTGVGSLRNAIELANENPGLDKIIIETDNINLNSEIEIVDALEIEGNSVVYYPN